MNVRCRGYARTGECTVIANGMYRLSFTQDPTQSEFGLCDQCAHVADWRGLPIERVEAEYRATRNGLVVVARRAA